jgi:hypothetical protein
MRDARYPTYEFQAERRPQFLEPRKFIVFTEAYEGSFGQNTQVLDCAAGS